MEPQIIRIWRAPKGKPAKYVTVDDAGNLVKAFESLSAISKYYKHATSCGAAILKRELENTYIPKHTGRR